MAGTWERDDSARQWELVVYDTDILRQATDRVVIGWVTDGFLERFTPASAAAYLVRRFGSVPPPFAGYCPAGESAVTYTFTDPGRGDEADEQG